MARPAPAVLPELREGPWGKLRQLEVERNRAAAERREAALAQPDDRLRIAEARRKDEAARKVAIRAGQGRAFVPKEEDAAKAANEDLARKRLAAANALIDIEREVFDYVEEHQSELMADIERLLTPELSIVEEELVAEVERRASRVALLEDWEAFIRAPLANVRLARRADLLRKLANVLGEIRSSMPVQPRTPVPPELSRTTLSGELLKQERRRAKGIPYREWKKRKAEKEKVASKASATD